MPEHTIRRTIHVHSNAYHVKRKLKECMILLLQVEVCKVELQRVGQSGSWHGASQPVIFSIDG